MAKEISNIDNKFLSQIVEVILSYKKPEKILIFGSRASGGFKTTSDIDLAIFARDWSDRDFNLIKDKLEVGVKTALKFDVIDFYDLSKKTLKDNILKKGTVIYDSRKD